MSSEQENKPIDIKTSEQTSVVEELDDQDLDEVAGGTNNCPIFNVVEGCGCG